MKKILITSTDVMMIQFLVPHVKKLIECGYEVTLGCSSAEGYEKEGYFELIQQQLPSQVKVNKIRTSRHPYAIKNLLGLYDLKQILKDKYDLVWTNEPVMGVMTRLAASKSRKKGTKVMYMAHGFHFFKGAPKLNWIFYFIEKLMSRKCDYITVINWEDYELVKEKFKKPVFHIDGIGVDFERLNNVKQSREEKRKELGIKENDFFVLSVGELHECKNHEVIIKALSKLHNPKIQYFICGKGELENHLKEISKELGINSQVHFLGHRYDIPDILNAADVFAHPSKREGLGIAALEAMAMGLPVIASNRHGLKDFVIDDVNGYSLDPEDIDGYANAIIEMMNNPSTRKKMSEQCVVTARKYSRENTICEVYDIITEVLGEFK